jgi:diguanylate cyclase (GGDEF)-like protein
LCGVRVNARTGVRHLGGASERKYVGAVVTLYLAGEQASQSPLRHACVVNFFSVRLLANGKGERISRIALTWLLLCLTVSILAVRGLWSYFVDHGNLSELLVSIAIAALMASAVINARAAGRDVERRHQEAESFSRIMRALSRSVSPDAVVEAIVHQLGSATQADHVAVVRLRPGSPVLDVTFVSMLPGAPTSNTIMPLRHLEPLDSRRLSEPPRPRSGSGSMRLVDGELTSLWREERPSGPAAAANEATATLRRNVRSEPRPIEPSEDETRSREVADRLASRLRDAYGLRNTLAAPLLAGRSMTGAIILSRRTSGVWPDTAVRLLNAAAFETSAALARVYSHQMAESEARTDQLTQLPNRRYFDEYCKLLASRRRTTDRVSIVAVDVDHFKKLNDQFGHQAGDLVLRSIGNAIQASVREEDVPVRFGGEEFMVLLRNPGPGVALEIGERIRQSVRDLDLAEHGVTGRVTVSIGVATATRIDETVDEIVERADRALYAAKRTGRDRVVEAWQAEAPNSVNVAQ